MNARRLAAAVVVAGAAAVPAVVESAAGGGPYVAAKPVCTGVARWPVKTLSDSAAASLDTKRTVVALAGLASLKAPPHIGNTLPRQAKFGGVEFKLYTMTVRLVGWKTEGDNDIHVAVRSLAGRQTMVIEFPLAGCIAKSASKLNRGRMARAKASLLKACGPAPGTSQLYPLRGTATVTGVGFFDKKAHASDSSRSGVELHPVIAFASKDCRAGP